MLLQSHYISSTSKLAGHILVAEEQEYEGGPANIAGIYQV